MLKEKKYAAYFTPSGIPPVFGQTPTVFTAHDLSFYDFPAAYSLADQFRLRVLERIAGHRATRIVTPSTYVAEQIHAHWQVPAEKVVVAQLGLTAASDESEMPDFIDGADYFVCVGRIELKKNLKVVISAFERYVTQGGGASLVLAGGPGYGYEEIQTQILLLPAEVRQKLILAGYVSAAERNWLYRHAIAVLVPGPYEGFGLPVLEGFAAKKPVLVASAGAAFEVAGDAAVPVAPDSVVAWIDALTEIEKNKELRHNLIETGTRRLEQFTWEQTATQTAAALLAASTLSH